MSPRRGVVAAAIATAAVVLPAVRADDDDDGASRGVERGVGIAAFVVVACLVLGAAVWRWFKRARRRRASSMITGRPVRSSAASMHQLPPGYGHGKMGGGGGGAGDGDGDGDNTPAFVTEEWQTRWRNSPAGVNQIDDGADMEAGKGGVAADARRTSRQADGAGPAFPLHGNPMFRRTGGT